MLRKGSNFGVGCGAWACVGVVVVMAIPAGAEGGEGTELKSFAAAEAVYVVHEGPAWGLGKTFGQVHEVMARQGQSGAMFARYVGILGEDEERTGADSTAKGGPESRIGPQPEAESSGGRGVGMGGGMTQVGFFATGTVELEPGFVRETIPAMEAATQTVAGSFGVSGAQYRSMVAWAEERGHGPTGDVIEVYAPKGEGPATVEIRIPVERGAGAVAAVEEAGPDPRSVAQLAADGDYAALGAAVFPRRVSPERAAWVGDVADRLRVIREIVRKKYGGGSRDVFEMLGAVVERAEKVVAGPGTSRAAPSAKSSPATEQIKKRQRDVLAELDRILVRAHVKSLKAGELREQVVAVLEEVRSIAAGTTVPGRPAEQATAVEERGGSADE